MPLNLEQEDKKLTLTIKVYDYRRVDSPMNRVSPLLLMSQLFGSHKTDMKLYSSSLIFAIVICVNARPNREVEVEVIVDHLHI